MTNGLRIGGERQPLPLDADRALGQARDLRAAATAEGCDRLAVLLDDPAHPDAARLGAVLDLSSYLNGIMLRRPAILERLFEIDAAERVAEIVARLLEPLPDGIGEGRLMTELREAKAEISLILALRDLFGAASEDETTRGLSAFAEAAVRRTVRFCLLDLQRRGALALPDPANPETGCGLIVLGMGKLGGRELNYSSDIDLILLFDPDVPAVVDAMESVETFSRLARRLVRIIGERTRDGYVFRTDLRLRPDPSAMPLAIPLPTALIYYETAGRDWERAAMIKARCVAGDEAVAAEFIDAIAPFVWRRYLDFAAIRDIRAMKQRIDSHRGFEGIALAGHNVKLGRGGIREIEFFAQTQQLVAGGRAPELRVLRTDEALQRLAEGGWIEPATARSLTDDYWFLRRVEHALQMVADEQTHTLPEEPMELTRIARLLAFPTLDAFADEILAVFRRVEATFGTLFPGKRGKGATHPTVAVLSDPDDETALNWLAAEGFRRPTDVARIVNVWGTGRYRALRTERAREGMRDALPGLLRAFAEALDPDAAVAAFDRFLAGLPAGIQFFSLVSSNPKLMNLLATVITAAPGLAETIARRPHVFDSLLDPAFFGELPDRDLVASRLAPFLSEANGHEERLDRLRIFNAEQRFLIGARLLSGAIEGAEAGKAFTYLAETVIEALSRAVEDEFVRQHGSVSGGRLALLGLGRLGSGELTATSDVDLILLYDHDANAEESDGDRPLAVQTYYARLTQRLIAALTAPMAEGILYDVDFRLRPSGNKGPLATEIGSFRRYQTGEAWTWEHMALTRSRPIAGDERLQAEVAGIIRDVVAASRDQPTLAADVAAMRERIGRDKAPRGPLDLKLRPGGLVDLEFIAQYAILAGQVPIGAIGRPTAEILAALAKEGGEDGRILSRAIDAFTRTIQIMRLGPERAWRIEDLPRTLAARLAQTLEVGGPADIEPALEALAGEVRLVFDRLLPPAQAAAE